MNTLPERIADLDQSVALRPCIKRPITINATQMDEPFRVRTMGRLA